MNRILIYHKEINLSDYYRPSGLGGFSFFPPVIKNLMIINGIVFLIEMLGQQISIGYGYTFNDVLTRYFALIPLGYGFYPWQLITYQFMHGGFMHIFFNMFALWMFGMEIENLWGSKKFLTFYLMCGIAAGIFQLVFPPLFNEPLAPTIGASGAIFGVLIAFGMLFPNRYIFIWFLIPLKAKYFVALYVLIEFFSLPSGGDVAHLAHLGGALAGFIYLMIDRKRATAYGRYSGPTSNSSVSPGSFFDAFRNAKNVFKKKGNDVQEANFYEIHDSRKDEEISQEDIDQILDKISKSGYQNLSEKEKKILFEASKKMK